MRDARQRVAEVEAQAAAAGRAADYRAKESIEVRLYLPRSCNFGRGEVVPGGGGGLPLAGHTQVAAAATSSRLQGLGVDRGALAAWDLTSANWILGSVLSE